MTFRNVYIRDGHVTVLERDGLRVTALWGKRLIQWWPSLEPPGRPDELVIHIAGTTWYPTRRGFVALRKTLG